SVLGMLIPPSAIMILYAWIANQSVLAAFLSTVVPGLILAVLLSIFSLIYLRKDPNVKTIAKTSNVTFQPRKRLSLFSWISRDSAAPALLMPLLILGSIYG